MPLIATRGAASAQGFGEFAQAAAPTYIEDVFSTYLYTGNGSSQTITNNIDLSGKGGLTWIKSRSNARNHVLFDTLRGATQRLFSNLTSAQSVDAQSLTAFNANGFSVGSDSDTNASTYTYASWTFREQPKFFDVVTYTGNGSNRTISHNLGSVPGCIIVKRTDAAADWQVYHRSVANTKYLVLNTTAGEASGTTRWNSTTPTATVFSLGTNSTVNANGGTYVAYLFAHDAGGFGLTGADSVISCGSYTGNGTGGDYGGTIVTLGWEPQFVIIKAMTEIDDWSMFDTMRGFALGNDVKLYPNLSDAEATGANWLTPLSTGFQLASSSGGVNALNKTYIYIAIRRGPMKTPTSGTSVFAPVVYAGNGTTQNITSGFANDMQIIRRRASAENTVIEDKLRGKEVLFTDTTGAGLASTGDVTGYLNTGFTLGASNQGSTNDGGSPSYISWNFGRAPGFFDEVCYTGDGNASQELSHNLGVTPTLILTKMRNDVYDWLCYSSTTGTSNTLYLNLTNASTAYTIITSPTATKFTVNNLANNTGVTYVAYLFASCPGVSKVGSYTGTGTTLQVDCGFTGGARFVLIKRTDSTGAWYVWDSARGIVAGNDPYLLLNSTATEVTNTDYVDTYSAGFEISSTAPAAINANGGTFIFLAIA